MARRGNSSPGESFKVTLSHQSVQMLEELAKRGLYGRNSADVAARFIDQALERFAEAPRFKLDVNRVKALKGGDNAPSK